MIVSKIIIIILIILFTTSISFCSTKLEEEIKSLEKNLYHLRIDIQKKKKVLQELKKILILTIIKQNLSKSNFLSLSQEKEYYKIKEKHEFYLSYYQNLEKKIKEHQTKLNELKMDYEKKMKKLKEAKLQYAQTAVAKEEIVQNPVRIKVSKDHLIDPITGETASPGKYKRKVPPGVLIKIPHSGIVKKIKFTNDIFAVTIEGPKCSSTIIGLSVLRVNVGDSVKAGQVLGESGFSEEENNLIYEIECLR